MNEILVIYHKDCIDGFMSAYITREYLGRNAKVDYVPLGYEDRDKFIQDTDFIGRTVFILDFSFSNIDTTRIINKAEETIWLDHHKTAFKNWLGVDKDYFKSKKSHQYIVLDKEKSGAILTWEYFKGSIETPNSVRYIDDRDRWIFKYEISKQFHLGLSQIPMTFIDWDSNRVLYDADPIVNAGAYIENYYNSQLKRSMEQTKENCLLKGEMGLCCNLPPMFASDAGHILATESETFGATWFRGSDGKYKWSLRSNGDFDVSEIAKYYGGGGHKNAAGFVIDYPLE